MLSDSERETLQALTMRRKTAQALALRARIVLACAGGTDNTTVAAKQRVSKSKTWNTTILLLFALPLFVRDTHERHNQSNKTSCSSEPANTDQSPRGAVAIYRRLVDHAVWTCHEQRRGLDICTK